MPLSPAILKGLIISEITNQYGAPTDPEQLEKFATSIANAVVTHITTSATVNVVGVTPGGGAAVGTIL
jgi:hypothetical protein